jgi:hypothetical protein
MGALATIAEDAAPGTRLQSARRRIVWPPVLDGTGGGQRALLRWTVQRLHLAGRHHPLAAGL